MTAPFLLTELSALIADAPKRRHPEVRAAAEHAHAELRAIAVTSEAQLAADLARKLRFVDAFVLACGGSVTTSTTDGGGGDGGGDGDDEGDHGNATVSGSTTTTSTTTVSATGSVSAKLAARAVVCLQRLAAARAIPRARLGDVVRAFRALLLLADGGSGGSGSSGSSTGPPVSVDVQLKILQTLPALLQLYAADMKGALLAATIEVCGALENSRAPMVSRSAAATLTQLVTAVWERVRMEDARDEEDEEKRRRKHEKKERKRRRKDGKRHRERERDAEDAQDAQDGESDRVRAEEEREEDDADADDDVDGSNRNNSREFSSSSTTTTPSSPTATTTSGRTLPTATQPFPLPAQHSAAAFDAARIFNDLCALADWQPATFVARLDTLSPLFLLELIGSVLAGFGDVVLGPRHPEQLAAVRAALLPALANVFRSPKAGFAPTVRALRILSLLLLSGGSVSSSSSSSSSSARGGGGGGAGRRPHLAQLRNECEEVFGILLKLLDGSGSGGSSTPVWKRVVCLEFFRGIYGDLALVRQLYELYDGVEGRRDVVAAILAGCVRVASENPTLIGLGRQSTVPTRPAGSISSGNSNNNSAPGAATADFALVDVGSAEIAGFGYGAMGLGGVQTADSSATGLSTEWSGMAVPCLDQLDKTDPPDIPPTYLPSLVVHCVTAFADGLSRFVMPLSVVVPGSSSGGSSGRAARSHRAHSVKGSEGDADVPVLDSTSSAAHTTDLERPGTADSSSVPPPPPPPPAPVAAARAQRHLLVNPLTLSSHPLYKEIQICAAAIDSCWPAFLAICSTFLNAALDSTFYHDLVRAVQKMTQVAGILGLTTPRDALLTKLGKSTIPTNAFNAAAAAYARKASWGAEAAEGKDAGGLGVGGSQLRPTLSQRQTEPDRPTLSIRNLLCLRALLNLGIALGPTLSEAAWFILMETLQQAELLMEMSRNRSTGSIDSSNNIINNHSSSSAPDQAPAPTTTSLGSEFAAVQTASKRMFDSTKNYNDEAFRKVVNALLKLSGGQPPLRFNRQQSLQPYKAEVAASPTIGSLQTPQHQGSRSMSGMWRNSKSHDAEARFVLGRLGFMAHANLERFVNPAAFACSWGLIVPSVQRSFVDTSPDADIRLLAASVIDSIVVESAKLLELSTTTTTTMTDESAGGATDPQSGDQDVLLQCLWALAAQLPLQEQHHHRRDVAAEPASADGLASNNVEIHIRALEALEALLGQCGELHTQQWDIVFALIKSACVVVGVPDMPSSTRENDKGQSEQEQQQQQQQQQHHDAAGSLRRVQVGFRSLQLVGSDFLGVLPPRSLAAFVEALQLFALQAHDLNIALTSTAFFWTVASLLHDRTAAAVSGGQIEVHAAPRLDSHAAATGDILTPSTPDPAVQAGAVAQAWWALLLKLKRLVFDRRTDVRNSSIRVLLKVVSAAIPKLTARTLRVCVNSLFLEVLRAQHQASEKLARASSASAAAAASMLPDWEKSQIQVLEGVTELVAQHLDVISDADADANVDVDTDADSDDEVASAFDKLWLNLLATLRNLLGQRSLNISSAVHTTISTLYDALDERALVTPARLTPAFNIWLSFHPCALNDAATEPAEAAPSSSSAATVRNFKPLNQAALTAYAGAFLSLLKCRGEGKKIDAATSLKINHALQAIVFRCQHDQYTSDVSKTTPEQAKVVEILPLLARTGADVEAKAAAAVDSSEYVLLLLKFVAAPLDEAGTAASTTRGVLMEKRPPAKGASGGLLSTRSPSFVAFSSACIGILCSTIRDWTATTSNVSDANALLSSLELPRCVSTLARLVESKYTAQPQGPSSSSTTRTGGAAAVELWKTANTAAVDVVDVAMKRLVLASSSSPLPLPLHSSSGLPSVVPALFSAINALAAAILGPGGLETLHPVPAYAKIVAEEDFDSAAFARLHASVLPHLSAPLPLSSSSSSPETAAAAAFAAVPLALRKAYVLVLFRASFAAAPRPGDLPDTLLSPSSSSSSSSTTSQSPPATHPPATHPPATHPLKHFSAIRAGTITLPTFAWRTRIPYVALDMLFHLATVAAPPSSSPSPSPSPSPNISTTPPSPSSSPSSPASDILAITAAPYILLRLAHPLRSFVADQPLRGAAPCPRRARTELRHVLRLCLGAHTRDAAFAPLFAMQTDKQNATAATDGHLVSGRVADSTAGDGGEGGDRGGDGRRSDHQRGDHHRHHRRSSTVVTHVGGIASAGDGCAHLRLLAALVRRVEAVWRRAPRLPRRGEAGCAAWQDSSAESRDIERALAAWMAVLASAWVVGEA